MNSNNSNVRIKNVRRHLAWFDEHRREMDRNPNPKDIWDSYNAIIPSSICVEHYTPMGGWRKILFIEEDGNRMELKFAPYDSGASVKLNAMSYPLAKGFTIPCMRDGNDYGDFRSTKNGNGDIVITRRGAHICTLHIPHPQGKTSEKRSSLKAEDLLKLQALKAALES